VGQWTVKAAVPTTEEAMDQLTGRRRHTMLVGLTAAALLAGGTGAALADAGAPTAPANSAPSASTAPQATAAPPTSDGARKLCHRVPRIDRRLDRALKRLNAGAGVRGSIARLQQRVDNAEAAGHAEIEKFLDGRLTFRKSLVTTLEQRQRDLRDVRTWCKANDNGKQED
jgi:hypothetical protein